MNNDKTLQHLQAYLLDLSESENVALRAEVAALRAKLEAGVSGNQKADKGDVRAYMLTQLSAGEIYKDAYHNAAEKFGLVPVTVRKQHPKKELLLIVKILEAIPDSTSVEALTSLLKDALLPHKLFQFIFCAGVKHNFFFFTMCLS